MSKKLAPCDTFHIDFNTIDMPGRVTGVAVTLKREFIAMDQTVQIDLRDHPLYPALAAYVAANPVGKNHDR